MWLLKSIEEALFSSPNLHKFSLNSCGHDNILQGSSSWICAVNARKVLACASPPLPFLSPPSSPSPLPPYPPPPPPRVRPQAKLGLVSSFFHCAHEWPSFSNFSKFNKKVSVKNIEYTLKESVKSRIVSEKPLQRSYVNSKKIFSKSHLKILRVRSTLTLYKEALSSIINHFSITTHSSGWYAVRASR